MIHLNRQFNFFLKISEHDPTDPHDPTHRKKQMDRSIVPQFDPTPAHVCMTWFAIHGGRTVLKMLK